MMSSYGQFSIIRPFSADVASVLFFSFFYEDFKTLEAILKLSTLRRVMHRIPCQKQKSIVRPFLRPAGAMESR